MKKATLLDSLLRENEQEIMEEIVDQDRIEKEVKKVFFIKPCMPKHQLTQTRKI